MKQLTVRQYDKLITILKRTKKRQVVHRIAMRLYKGTDVYFKMFLYEVGERGAIREDEIPTDRELVIKYSK